MLGTERDTFRCRRCRDRRCRGRRSPSGRRTRCAGTDRRPRRRSARSPRRARARRRECRDDDAATASGVPMLCVAGSVGQLLRRAESCAISASGDSPVSTPRRRMLRVTDASRSGIVASVADNCACARDVSSCVPRPASSRAVRDAQRLALILGVALCDFEPLLRAAQLEVVARDFSRDADLRAVHAGFGRLHVAPSCASTLRRTRPKKSSSQNASKPAS